MYAIYLGVSTATRSLQLFRERTCTGPKNKKRVIFPVDAKHVSIRYHWVQSFSKCWKKISSLKHTGGGVTEHTIVGRILQFNTNFTKNSVKQNGKKLVSIYNKVKNIEQFVTFVIVSGAHVKLQGSTKFMHPYIFHFHKKCAFVQSTTKILHPYNYWSNIYVG